MPLISSPRDESVFSLCQDLAQVVSTCADETVAALGQGSTNSGHGERLEDLAARSAALQRRVANRLATSLITPFEADAIYDFAANLDQSVQGMRRLVDIAERMEFRALPVPVLEALDTLPRIADMLENAAAALEHAKSLVDVPAELRRILGHADTHVHRALAEAFKVGAQPMEALRTREILTAIEGVCASFANAGRALDLLRIKDA